MSEIDELVAAVRGEIGVARFSDHGEKQAALVALDRLAATARERDELLSLSPNYRAAYDAERERAEAAEESLIDSERDLRAAEVDRDRLARRVEQLETLLRNIAGYKHPLGMSTRDSFDEAQRLARAALSSQPIEPQETA